MNQNDAKMDMFFDTMDSPFGILYIGASQKGLRQIKLLQGYSTESRPNEIVLATISQLKDYFLNKLQVFTLDYDLEAYSDFSIRVWQQLLKIPYGSTISYQQLAHLLGNPKCIRAAASANGRNPIPIIIPCHRVIGSDGSLTGYALGLEMKKKLLALENNKAYGWEQTTLPFF